MMLLRALLIEVGSSKDFHCKTDELAVSVVLFYK